MTNHVARLYAFVGAVLVLFVAWAMVTARPWAEPAATRDARAELLAAREKQLRQAAVLVRRVVAERRAAPAVRLTALPPVTATKSS